MGGSHQIADKSVLLTLLAVVTIAIVRQRNLFSVVILASIYSFLMASVLIVLDAVDVAMTEASVGAGVSTVLLLATLHLIKTTEIRAIRPHLLPLSVRSALAQFSCGARSFCRPSALRMRQSMSMSRRAISHDTMRETMSERRDFGPRRLPRLRYARRDDGDLHGRHRRAAAAAPARRRGRANEAENTTMSLDLILRVGTKLILPFILLFALYVQFHGDYGPGGGFQAGVIAASVVILLAITFGLEAAHRIAPNRWWNA